ncbi:hypothetical protein GN244_ATG03000 [Phytophthora infestans]|uniref:Uncharacterized protein n=1 Tax=Phytophthora infestans TaxID=4787 RepID=A0A833T247_PHYIN|nr:hypothetical protein GN244_ATG03000 [Phytophthora infestans]
MSKTTARETYEAFKARQQREFNTRHAGQSQTTQQKLLRVHLRHYLLTIGAEVGHEQQQTEDCKDLVNLKEDVNGINEFAREQKRRAIEREAAKAKRKHSAQVIHKFLRPHIRNKDEIELPSTSVLIPLEVEKAVAPLQSTTELVPARSDLIPDPPPPTTMPPYELVINVAAVRDLTLDSATLDGKYLETELQLKRQSDVVFRVSPARQLMSSFHESNTEIQLHGCSLRFPIDMDNNAMRHRLASPQSVINESSATVIVKTTDNNGGGSDSLLGVVEIPLSLLETPLATEYALYRWFPLEKAYPGHTARGDVRVSVCYLMRQQSSDGVTMVPYVNATSSSNTNGEVEGQQTKPPVRRVKKATTKATSRSFMRSRAEQATDKSEQKKPPVLSLKDASLSPIGRISRAEALSPPPSPSSVTSSEAGENVASPKAVKSRRPLLSSKRKLKPSKAMEKSPPKEEQVAEAKEISSQTPPRTFLKRKPYKVVFQKLNWSSVSSKTDSNLSTSNKSHKNNAATKTSRPSSRASSASLTTSNNGDADQVIESLFTLKPAAFIDAATAERLATLEAAMYKQCGVTQDTVSLARFKYQKERKQFVATLHRQTQRGTEAVDQPPSQESSEIEIGTATSETAVTEIWKKLTGDSSGQIYASMLRNLAKLTEPDVVT